MIENAYRQSVQTPVSDIATFLQEWLSPRLSAYVVGVKDTKTVARWAKGEVTDLRQSNEEKLRTAYAIAQLLMQYDSPQTVRAWFIGLNPQLGDVSPAETIRKGQIQEALAAARAFVVGG